MTPTVVADTVDLTARWHAALCGTARIIGLADGEDIRAIEAAHRLHLQNLVVPRLFGRGDVIRRVADRAGIPLHDDLVVDIERLADDELIRDVIHDRMVTRPQHVAAALTDPVSLAAAALRAGYLHGCVAGATRPTADVLRAGLRIVGLTPGLRTLSSAFLMVLPDGRTLTFSDCAVVPDPDPAELADIALAASTTHLQLAGQTPVVAMLSFSTQGSASHPRVDRVRAATELVRAAAPDLHVDGDLQFDAALIAEVGLSKAPGSTVAGRANVFVFPNLDAGNIGYKIAQRLGGATAMGPILQGISAPLNDLSRGCDSRDIELMATVSAVQSLDTE
jgi:phosphotransacetylase